MNPAAIHAAVIALAIVASAAVLFTAAVIACAMLRPEPPGRHRLDGDETARFWRSLATETPAAAPRRQPAAAPQSAPPGGVAPLPHPASPGVGQPQSPAPLSKALEAAPGGTGPAGGVPAPPAPEPGRHPFDDSRPTWYVLTSDEVADYQRGPVRVYGTSWHGHVTETGGQPALVRHGRLTHEAWRDAAVNQ